MEDRKLLWDLGSYEIIDEDGNFVEWDREAMKEDLLDTVSTHIKSACVLIDAQNINWRGSSGYKVIDLDTDADGLFNKLIPDYECSFKIYLEHAEMDTEIIYAVVSSHDVPTGGIWNFIPCKDVESELEDIVYHIGDGSHGYNKKYFFNKIDSVFPEVDINNWSESDITSECNFSFPEDTQIVSVGNDIFTLYLDSNDDIIASIDYYGEDFAEYYYKAIRGLI